MGTEMPNERQWLQAEQNGQEELAEAVFARLVAGMPAIEPSAAFVDATAQAAWQASTRRRAATRGAAIAAGLAAAAGGLGAIYELRAPAASLVARGTVAMAEGLVWLTTSVGEGARWWWVAERIGTAASDAFAAPAAAAGLAAAGMIALAAIYALQQLIGHSNN
jgi:hypothetical protein